MPAQAVKKTSLVQRTFKRVNDSYQNFLTGLGLIGRDKAQSGTFVVDILTDKQIEDAYRSDWITRKAIDIPAFDSTRKWRAWQADDTDITKIEDVEKALNVKGKVREAMTLARLYGGAAIIIGADSGPMDQELNLERVGRDSLKFLHVVPKHHLSHQEIEYNITSPWYGRPTFYEPNLPPAANNLRVIPPRIHPSRIIRLVGHDIPDAVQSGEVWGDSVLLAIQSAVLAAASVSASIAHMIAESKLDIYSVKKLDEILSDDEGTNRMLGRFAHVNSMKSVVNSVVIDLDEKLERLTMQFAGIPEVMQMYLLIVCGAVDVPATRFLGQSPAGMNATGESDFRNYYDRRQAEQDMLLSPALYMLDEVVIRSALGKRDPAIHYTWNSLWQMDDKEKAEIAKSKAETANIHAALGVIPESAFAKALQNQLIEDGVYPGLESAIDEAELAGEGNPGDPEFQIEQQQAEEEKQKEQLQLQQAANNNQPPPNNKQAPQLKLVQNKDGAWQWGDRDLRPLYVYRDLQNTDEFVKWAKGQGLEDIEEELHVTILYSKDPVDWIKLGNDNEYSSSIEGKDDFVIPEGGPRVVERLGQEGAVVLHFSSSRLCWRHESMVTRGASHSYDEYQPHLTITYKYQGVDTSKIEPYRGRLVFGPEIFEEIK